MWPRSTWCKGTMTWSVTHTESKRSDSASWATSAINRAEAYFHRCGRQMPNFIETQPYHTRTPTLAAVAHSRQLSFAKIASHSVDDGPCSRDRPRHASGRFLAGQR